MGTPCGDSMEKILVGNLTKLIKYLYSLSYHYVLVAFDGQILRYYTDWRNAHVTFSQHITLFVLQGVRGGKTIYHGLNDLCVDDFFLQSGDCAGKNFPLSLS